MMFSINRLFNNKPEKISKAISFEGSTTEPQEGEVVLDTLLRAGHAVPYGCRAGACQSCMMVCEEGEVPAEAQQNLTHAQQEQGYFLACSCTPTSPMSVALKPKTQEPVIGEVIEKNRLNKEVAQVRIKASLDYRPGQFVNLYRNGALYRSYSLASVPGEDDYLEFHIKRVESGRFSPWVFDKLEAGAQLAIEGPLGLCFYTPIDKQQPMLLAGLGTGLAPLYGIVRDALINHRHGGPIQLFVGSRDSSQLYLIDELQQLATCYPNLTLHLLALESSDPRVQQGDIYQQIQHQVPSCKGYKVFLCGADSFVKKMKKQCFLAGADMADIATDSFLPSGSA